ncbi:hypothetical protein [Lentzea sp.]|uniref:hypothetical protein n=1 Tax=Lentzea sp. TaxID=56099 RepID=UPI002CAA272A|nr:hypothetical protein [Lentzea sp.]HUQ56356.1 hypothetical protein [Lentzea sp.]
MEAFLDEWLAKVSAMDGHDLAFAVPAHRIGTALTALARSRGLRARFHPMIKPYHRFPVFSEVPLPLPRELAEVLPADARIARLAEWRDSE